MLGREPATNQIAHYELIARIQPILLILNDGLSQPHNTPLTPLVTITKRNPLNH